MRLIDANALRKELLRYYSEQVDTGSPMRYGAVEAIWLVKIAPTIDAVQVVRCKDCKYHYMTNCYNPKWEDTGVPGTEPFDFCSYGERR